MREKYDYTKLVEYMRANPLQSIGQIAAAVGCDRQYVYNVRHRSGISKKVTMPKRKKLQVVRKTTLTAKDTRIAELEQERLKLQKELDFSAKKVKATELPTGNEFPSQLVEKINGLNAIIVEKNDEINQLQGVIKYLEKNLREALARLRAKNGSTV
jgi:hypothetical protein